MKNGELVRQVALPFALGAIGGAIGVPLLAAATLVAVPAGWLLLIAGSLAITSLIVRDTAHGRTDGWRAWRATLWLLLSALTAIPIVLSDGQSGVLAVVLPVLTGGLAVAVDQAGRRLFGAHIAA